jgi:hypothetical protein
MEMEITEQEEEDGDGALRFFCRRNKLLAMAMATAMAKKSFAVCYLYFGISKT